MHDLAGYRSHDIVVTGSTKSYTPHDERIQSNELPCPVTHQIYRKGLCVLCAEGMPG